MTLEILFSYYFLTTVTLTTMSVIIVGLDILRWRTNSIKKIIPLSYKDVEIMVKTSNLDIIGDIIVSIIWGPFTAGFYPICFALKFHFSISKKFRTLKKLEQYYCPQFKSLQDSWESARRYVKEHGELSFDELPVFPFKTPYSEGIEKEQGAVRFRKDKDVDDLMNDIYRLFYKDMSELIYLRGDKHCAAASDSRVLLIIKEVEQSGRDLAIVAVVLASYGADKEISVRFSCFPRTIHRDEPRVEIQHPYYNNDYDYYYYRYFAAQYGWVNSGTVAIGGSNICVPTFAEETENAVKRLAYSVFEKLCREYKPKTNV